MLPKEHRLKRDRDFRHLFKEGDKVFRFPFAVRFISNKTSVSRFAVVVGTKVSKKAVERNRLRRQVREVLRLHFAELAQGYDVGIVVQSGAKGMTYAELEKNLLSVLGRAKLL